MRNQMLTLLFAAAISSCGSKTPEKPAEFQKATVIPVRLMPLQSEATASMINASGIITTEDELRLAFKIGGAIEIIPVKEGDHVKKGQILARLKPTEIAAQVQQVALGLEKAQRDYQRVLNLYRDSVATLEQLQNAKTGVDVAEQNLRQVSFNRDYSVITAPADGYITRKLANAGEMIGSNSPVLVMNAASANSRWIMKTGLSDHDWSVVEPGDGVVIATDAYPGKKLTGRITRKSVAADPATGTFPVEITLDMAGIQPAVGMFGKAVITLSRREAGYRIPYEALLEVNGKNGFVFVSDDRKTVKRVPVTLGSITETAAYVSDGLEDHRFLVTTGSPFLRDGSAITESK